MIIACPACATRYEVPDSAIPDDGRTVRCAKCRHSWFQEAAEAEAFEQDWPSEQDWPDAEPAADEPDAQPAPDDDTGSGEDLAAYVGEVPIDAPAPAEIEPEPLPDPAEPAASADEGHVEVQESADPQPRARGRFRLWAWAALVFVGLAGLTAAAASYWGMPDWAPFDRPAFAATQPGLELNFPAERQERRQLPNGTEFFGASGTITNVGSGTQIVPPILIVLRDQRDRIVYSWEVAPSKRQLAPGETISVNEAITDVPRSARVAEIGWKPA